MSIHERRYNSLRRLVDNRLRSLITHTRPKELTDACRYVLSAGGKRVRSTLVLLSCEAVRGNVRDAVDASAAIELMHNFTLVHDDIMDNAASRRGRATVHTRWSANTALLVGDVLIGFAYARAANTNSKHLRRILEVFTQSLIDVCEGQALDLEFEQRNNVTLEEYFDMIEKKTGSLLTSSTVMGGLVGNGTEKQIAALHTFGHYLGRAFQLQDDLLDVVAEETEFGKMIGGDILEGKKTFLLLKSLERATGSDRKALMRVMNRKSGRPLNSGKGRKKEVHAITAIYNSTGAIDAARTMIHHDTRKAEAALKSLPKSTAKESLLWFSEMLLKRNH